MSAEEQKYLVHIGLKQMSDTTAVVCKKGVDKIFADTESGKEFVVFYCCEGDKTLLRASEIEILISKKIKKPER